MRDMFDDNNTGDGDDDMIQSEGQTEDMTDLRPEAVTVSLNMLICSVAYDAKIVTYDVDNAQLSIQIRH